MTQPAEKTTDSLQRIDALLKWVDTGTWPSVPVNAFAVDEDGMAEMIRQIRSKTSVVISVDRLRLIRGELAELASLKAQLAEATETYTAPDGEVWSPPTAAAYYLACQALKGRRSELTAATQEVERLKAELEDARIYITSEDGSKLHIRNLLRCGLRSLRGKRGVFWARVADAFGVGSTSAHRLCRLVNLNPDTGEIDHDHA